VSDSTSDLSAMGQEAIKTSTIEHDNMKHFNKMAERLERHLLQEEFYKVFNPRVIKMVFFNIFFSNVVINIDHGTLPGCSDVIMKDLHMQEFEFGLLGSVVYGGLTVGAGVATGVYNNSSNAKKALIITLFLNSISIYLFTLSRSFYIDAFIRFWLGFF